MLRDKKKYRIVIELSVFLMRQERV